MNHARDRRSPVAGPVIGLDIGTSVTKSAVFDSLGREIAVASSRTEVSRPQPAWSEMDPEAVWHAVCTTCKAAVARSGVKPDDIAAVGVTGVMDIFIDIRNSSVTISVTTWLLLNAGE